jgi:uncharacterized protein YukE
MLEIDQFTTEITTMLDRWEEMQKRGQQEIKQLCDKMAELEKETRQTTELMQAARKQLTGDADLEYGACEVVRTYAWDSTGEDAVACGSGGRWYEDLGMYVCDHCIDKAGRA